MVYCTDEPKLDILVENGKFNGVVILITRTSQDSWCKNVDKNYCILYADGEILGNNKGYFYSSLEDSSDDDEWEYYLKKID